VSLFLKIANYKVKLTSSQDIVDAIKNQQTLSNLERAKNGNEPIDTIPIVHNFINDKLVNRLIVDHLRSYYNFFTDKDFELSSVIISDLRESFKIPNKSYEMVHAKTSKKSATLVEQPIVTEEFKSEFLKLKQTQINNLIALKAEYFKKKRPVNIIG
jgi:hypothetical protein